MKIWLNWNNAIRSHTSTLVRLELETLASRDLPSSTMTSAMALVDNTTPVPRAELVTPLNGGSNFTPFPGFTGTIVTATGDVNGDGAPDLIVAAEVPGIHVKVFDGPTGDVLQSFYAFPGFDGTVNLGADLNGDGHDDILTAANNVNGAIKEYSVQDGSLLSSFLAFPGYQGQVSVAGADFNNSGHDQIVVGAGAPGVGGRIAIFNPDGSLANGGFFAFPGYSRPINVAAGDINGDGVPDIIVGVGPGGPGGQVNIFSGVDFSLIGSFQTLYSGNFDGTLVGVDYDNGSPADILVANATFQAQGVSVYDLNGNDLSPPPEPNPFFG